MTQPEYARGTLASQREPPRGPLQIQFGVLAQDLAKAGRLDPQRRVIEGAQLRIMAMNRCDDPLQPKATHPGKTWNEHGLRRSDRTLYGVSTPLLTLRIRMNSRRSDNGGNSNVRHRTASRIADGRCGRSDKRAVRSRDRSARGRARRAVPAIRRSSRGYRNGTAVQA